MRKILGEAIESGEVLLIKYFGGSKPGASRQISPISFVGDEKIRVHCFASGRNKVFFINKIEVLDSTDQSTGNYETTPTPKEPQSLAEALYHQVDRLQALGWHVETAEDNYSLHRFFKNGKHRKTAVVSIRFHEFTQDTTDITVLFSVTIKRGEVSMSSEYDFDDQDIDDFEFETRKSVRPWVVGCTEANYTSAFKSLNNAAQKFMDLAVNRAKQE